MSTMGTSVAQSIAGMHQAQQASAPAPSSADAARKRREIRTGDQVEFSTELIDAVHDAADTTDEQPRQQTQQHPPHPGEGDAPPHLDVQA